MQVASLCAFGVGMWLVIYSQDFVELVGIPVRNVALQRSHQRMKVQGYSIESKAFCHTSYMHYYPLIKLTLDGTIQPKHFIFLNWYRHVYLIYDYTLP